MNDMRKLMEAVELLVKEELADFSDANIDELVAQFKKTCEELGIIDDARDMSELADTVVDRVAGERGLYPDPWAMESVESAQTANPVDTVTVDIPLLIRLLEFSREDAKTDVDLHQLADNLINLSPDGNTLTMADYEELVTGLAGDENAEGPGGLGHENALGNDHEPSYQQPGDMP